MKSTVHYALRTLMGPWLAVPVIALETTLFFQRGMPWLGEGMWTVEWFAISLFIIGPLCAGVAAVDAARLSRLGNIHLVVSVPRPSRVYLRAAAWCAGPLVVLHLLAIAAGVVVGQVQQPSVGWGSMLAAALIQCAAIVWYAALGSAIGRFAAPVIAGLIGGAAGFVLNYLVSNALSGEPKFSLLALGGGTITMLGKAYNPGYLAGQAVIFVLTSFLLLFLPLRTHSGFRIPTGGGLAVTAAAVAIVLTGPAVFPATRTVDRAIPPDHCVGTRPQVCMHYEHRRYAKLVVPHVQALARAALDAGYSAFVPEKIMENSRTYQPSEPNVRPLWLPAWTYEEGRLTLEDMAYHLLSPTHCEWIYNPVPGKVDAEVFDARFYSLITTWLSLLGTSLAHIPPVEHRILQPDEVREILDDFNKCDLDGRH